MQFLRTWWIPVFIGSVTLLALLLTEPHYGYAIDEASYLWVAREEREWCSKLWERPLAESFSAAGLASGWHFLEPPTGDVSTHSNFNLPLSMHLINVGWLVGHSFADELTSSRLAPILLFALTVTLVGHRLTQSVSLAGGLFAAVALVLMPRIFGHAHLAATETILSCFWTLTILALLRMCDDREDSTNQRREEGRTDKARWNAISVAILLSFTMSVKLSGWFLAPAVGFWLLLFRPRGWITALLFSIVLPIPMIIFLTPTLWHDPIGGLQRYLTLVLDNPWSISTYFLGEGYSDRLPFWSGPLLLAVTTPITILFLALWGAMRGIRDARVWAILLPTLTIIAAWMFGLLPTHDGERHLTPAAYGIALLAGCGFSFAFGQRGNSRDARRSMNGTSGLLALLLLAEPAYAAWTYREHGLLYYNGFVGGLPGAKDWGFETNYWMETVTDKDWHELLDDLPPNATVFLRPDHPGMEDLKRWGVWRADINATGPEANFYILAAKRAAYLIHDPETGKLVDTDLSVRADSAPMEKEIRFLGIRLIGRLRPPER